MITLVAGAWWMVVPFFRSKDVGQSRWEEGGRQVLLIFLWDRLNLRFFHMERSCRHLNR